MFRDLSYWLGIGNDSHYRFVVAVGVLPYPITFLCTDLISELYGRKRANMLVWAGLFLNTWVLLVLWFGGWLNAPENLTESGSLKLAIVNNQVEIPHGYAFYEIRKMAFGATFASMVAYLAAQFVDVEVFHHIKRRTKGKYLWLRNNASTMTSQLIDSIAVIIITHFYAHALPIPEGVDIGEVLLMFIISSYMFKFFFALFDTIPIYLLVGFLRKYLKIKDELSF